MSFNPLFPAVDRSYNGHISAIYFLVLLTLVSTARSLTHLLAPDGGAHSIAGIALNVTGGPNIVALFGQWGASQLVLAGLQWLVLLRYRFLVPVMLAVAVMEQLLRLLAGSLKPLEVGSAPPGTYGTYIVLALALLFLGLSLRRASPAGTS
jgi:hypothetical protein